MLLKPQTVQNIFKVRLSLSDTCNYRCFFCHNEGRQEVSRKKMNMDNILLLCSAAYLAGIRSFTFTGGEPFTNKLIFEAIRQVRSTYPDIIIKLTTNASYLRLTDIDFLQEHIDRIRINFQSPERNIFKMLVGYDGLPNLLILLDALKHTPTHICLNYVYNKLSKDQLKEVINFAITKHIELKVLELIRNDFNSKFYYPIETAKEYIESIASTKHKDYQNDDVYFIDGYSAKIRLCYAHCNTFDGCSCRLLGELRISPQMDIYSCMYPKSLRASVLDEKDPLQIAKVICEIDAKKGVCPPKFDFT
jgi:cyclic pyranopterin phosphate synthase